ncbi:MAG TPA: TonB-dependent receptor [Planctomycetota bacterium]|nr:TonB-dependent receptor [Planctomycetota bacterium]
MRKAFLLVGATLLFLARALAAQQEPEKKPPKTDQDLSELSLEDLMKVEITSVSKSEHSLMDTPAAVTVIRGEDIRRTGATTIAEALRLVPGMFVARLSSNKWLVASRGFSDLFSTKLLVLIDGRSVYTPLFSGVLWPAQDVDLEDVDRIEVIRGPGSTVWGANAVNGVINIITKKAKDTQGGRITGGGGTQERAFGSTRWGGMIGDDLAYRVYGKSFDRGPGKGVDDDWDGSQGGFRFDWTPRPSDSVTFQGDYYSVLADGVQTIFSATAPFSRITNQATEYSGGNLLLRWEHELAADSKLQTQFYYDHTEYRQPVIEELRDTLDFDLQHQVKLFWGQQLTSGLGYRWSRSNLDNTPEATLNHPHKVSDIASAFIQDEVALHEAVKMTIGSKFEYNNYTRFEAEPGLRLSIRPAENHSIWFSAARAVRTPAQADSDLAFAYTSLQPTVPPTLVRVSGSHTFESEDMTALEMGYRVQPHESVTLDVAAFKNHYSDLRTSEAGPPDLSLFPAAVILPLTLANKMHGRTWGVELAAAWQAMEGVRFQGGYTYLRMNLALDTGSTDLGSATADKNDPRDQAFLRGIFDVVKDVQFDVIGRYVSRLQGRGVPGYTEMDARIGWKILPSLEAALVGQNLLQRAHFESSNSSFSDHASEVPRGVYGSLTWKF